jgi:dTDP-4-amino-4,6-dideoxygalactose transaminase
MQKIYLSSPHLGTAEQKYVAEAFASNWIAPLGPHVDGFESDLQKYIGVGHAAALSSGTAAIHLALMLLGVGREDIVLCQSFTFTATANPIRYLGAIPVFIDSEADTWNMDPERLREACEYYTALGQKPKAILPVHLYGMPARMAEIKAIADAYGIPVVEDAAEALGSAIGEVRCGAMGQLNVLSFNGNKIITTSGGGALLSEDEALISKARYLATQARDPAPHYEHSDLGYNYRLSNVLAGIGRGQMEFLDDRVAARRALHDRYREYFGGWQAQGYNIQFQEEPDNYFSNRWLTCILVDPDQNHGLTRETIRLAMEAKNIESRPLWKPMHMQPVFKNFPVFGGSVSERFFEIGLCLPSGSNLVEADFERIFDSLDSVLRHNLTSLVSIPL